MVEPKKNLRRSFFIDRLKETYRDHPSNAQCKCL